MEARQATGKLESTPGRGGGSGFLDQGARAVTGDVEKGGVSHASIGPSRAMICEWLGHLAIAPVTVSRR